EVIFISIMSRYILFVERLCFTLSLSSFFFFNATVTTEIYTLSLHDALPIFPPEAKRNRISLYTIALEGYRRGLNLKFLNTVDEVGNNKLVYALSSGQTTHYFHESSGDLNTEAAQIICDNKSITYSYLQEANVPTP